MSLDTATQSLLASFLEVQRTRARLYAELHSGFKTLVGSRNEYMLQQLMPKLTNSFNDCSKQVLSIEAQLKDSQRQDLADLLRKVQENEREKLRSTLNLQTLKSAYAKQTFSWQHRKPGHDLDNDIDILDNHMEHVSLGGEGGHAHGCGCCGGGPPLEPSEDEYRGAVEEALVIQNDAIEAINDVLQEVNDMLADPDQ